jgi:lipopolysaccharide assembly outer membrane protein LptD (OstA)
LKYLDYELQADVIILNQETMIMEAYGVPDTANPTRYTGTPIFIEGSERYEAFKIVYNFKTRTGNITMGSTEMEGGYYAGDKIKQVEPGTFFIEDGKYTTCNLPEPHYYIGSPQMKIMQKDKLVAQPVFLYVDDIPVFAIPFGVFPSHSGRSSGLIAPAYGQDATYGFYLSHLGYFFAINDYIDLALQGNFFTKGRVDINSRFRYVKRYKYSGTLDLGGSRIRLGEPNDLDRNYADEWRIGLTHTQNVNPTTNINANVNIVSSKSFFNNSTNNLEDLLRQNALSNVTITKFWEESPYSLNINYFRDQNLVTGEIFQRIPSVNFTRSQTFPFRNKNTSLLDLKWYENVAFTYNANFLINQIKKLETDTTVEKIYSKDLRGGLQQVLNMNVPFKFSYFNLAPFFNYTEAWFNKYILRTFNPLDSQVITEDVKALKGFRYFNTGISLNTKIIGIFNTRIFGIRGIRHTINPTITYNYQPDFTKATWGIYRTYTDATGNEVLYNMFEREVFPGAPGMEVSAINFSVGNIFEMKTRATDTTENKFQLLNVDAGISYNFAADSLKLSELGLSYRTQIGEIFNISGNASFNFYKFIKNVGRINQYLWNTEKRIADLTSFNISMGTSLSGGELTTVDTSKTKDKELDDYSGAYEDLPPDFTIPWQLSLSYNYSINKFDPTVFSKSSNLSGSFSFSPTQNWKLSLSGSFDIFERQFSAPYVTVYRDLHCWEMSLNWIPLGNYRGFRFELKVKAPQLQDLKITRQSNFRGVY